MLVMNKKIATFINQSNDSFKKDTYYRLLQNSSYNWRKLLSLTTLKVLKLLHKVQDASSIKVFIVDDTVEGKTGKYVEGSRDALWSNKEKRNIRGVNVVSLDYRPERSLNKSQIQSLASLNFIRAHQNIIITGKTGTGKSYLAQAFANRAIIKGHRAHYVRTPSLLEEIRISRMDGTYTNLLKKYSRFNLLVLDDFGVAAMHDDDATTLFEIIEDRTEINSTIITSQLPVSEWYNYLNNNTIADAILDRVVHSSHRLELLGQSMRKLKSTIQKMEE